MNEPKPRKAAPKISEEIDRGLYNLNGELQSNRTPAESDKAVKPGQREPRPFHGLADYSKLQFGQKLIG